MFPVRRFLQSVYNPVSDDYASARVPWHATTTADPWPAGRVPRADLHANTMTTETDTVLLDATRADFLTHHVSILVGSCSADCVPSVARAYGCRVASDRRTVTVFLSVAQSQQVLRDLRAGSGIAVVFSLPRTHQTLQLKGARVHIAQLEDGDREAMRAYGRSFGEEVGAIGFGETFRQAIMSGVEEEAVAVSFTPSAAFEQTPGPSAGQPLALPS